MNSILKTAVLPAVLCTFCITACKTLPAKALYTEPAVADVTVNTKNNHFDVVYAINCCVMPKAIDDFVSFKVDTMLYTYRFDFSMHHGMKDILDRFLTVSNMADVQGRKNGTQYLGETTLYAYASSADKVSRLVANGKVANHVRFSFLMRDGIKYLLLEGFQVETLDGKLTVDDYIDSIPFNYNDIKKAYDFFIDTEQLEETRQKQLRIANAAEQAKKEKGAIVKTEQTSETADSVIVNTEESSAENQ